MKDGGYYLQKEKKMNKRYEHSGIMPYRCRLPKCSSELSAGFLLMHAHFHPKGTSKPMKIQILVSLLSQFLVL